MKQIIASAALFMTSCAPIQTHTVAYAIPTTDESRSFVNVANQGTVKVSDGDWGQYLAIDGDIDTWWSADDFAPQWLEITLPYSQLVEKIELIVTQVSPGPATHKIRMERAGKIVGWHRFDSDLAADGDVFALRLDPPQHINRVRILTTRHEGWVAWREVRILSSGMLSELVSGLLSPVQLTHAGDGSGRLFVLEREGRIRIVRDGVLVETPFLDISQRITAKGTEQGLLNVAFPPSYVDHQRFYVSYTDTNGDTVISRFVSSADPDRADPDSEEIILAIKQPGKNHNGGTLKFGPRDGYLYITSGDGMLSNFQDMPQHAQDPGTLLGKILRIDVESGAKPYAIPADNPFVSLAGYAPEIWALGLRNPWGIDFDQQTGALYIPDTGWYTNEEVNFQPAASGGEKTTGGPCLRGLFPWKRREPLMILSCR